MEKLVNRIRAVIYIAGIFAVTMGAISSVEAFWPADMVPHPHDPNEPRQEQDFNDPNQWA